MCILFWIVFGLFLRFLLVVSFMHVKRDCNMVAHSAVKNSRSEKTHTPTLDSLVVHVEKIKYMGVIRLLLNGGIRLYRPQSEKKGKRRSVFCSLLWTSFTQLTNSLWEEWWTTSIIHTTTISLHHHSPPPFSHFRHK